MKKIISIMLTILLLFVAASMFGCYKKEVYGDLVCGIRGGKTMIDIFGLSEEGKNKEIIIIPKVIDGYKVQLMGKSSLFGVVSPDFQSEKLKRLYFETELDYRRLSLQEAVNLEKVFILDANGNHIVSLDAKECFLNKLDADVYKEVTDRVRPANVAYFYNYENAPNDGYYWIDDLEDGEKITYIPENPTREGYLFGGWFKDEACTEVWDFEKDAIIKPAEGFYENKIFAKWNKKNY